MAKDHAFEALGIQDEPAMKPATPAESLAYIAEKADEQTRCLSAIAKSLNNQKARPVAAAHVLAITNRGRYSARGVCVDFTPINLKQSKMKRRLFESIGFAILLAIGCSNKADPAKPFTQTRAELTQVYQFERGELERLESLVADDEGRAADRVFHAITAFSNQHVHSFDELESYIRALPDDKVDDARKSVALAKAGIQATEQEYENQRLRTQKAKAELDAARQ